jgi:hypothetical protein
MKLLRTIILWPNEAIAASLFLGLVGEITMMEELA